MSIRQQAAWQARLEVLLEGLGSEERTRVVAELRDLVRHASGGALSAASFGAGGIAVGRDLQITAANDAIGWIRAGEHGAAIGHYHAAPQAPNPSDLQHARDRELETRRLAARQAAYSRFLSRIPNPQFSRVEWRRRSATGIKRIMAALSYEPVEPAYIPWQVEERLEKIRGMISDNRLDELGAYLAASSKLAPWDMYTLNPADISLYPAREVDHYFAELRSCLSDFFQERAQA
jgi:hypothetical protein